MKKDMLLEDILAQLDTLAFAEEHPPFQYFVDAIVDAENMRREVLEYKAEMESDALFAFEPDTLLELLAKVVSNYTMMSAFLYRFYCLRDDLHPGKPDAFDVTKLLPYPLTQPKKQEVEDINLEKAVKEWLN